jgi:hypothetical protein
LRLRKSARRRARGNCRSGTVTMHVAFALALTLLRIDIEERVSR